VALGQALEQYRQKYRQGDQCIRRGFAKADRKLDEASRLQRRGRGDVYADAKDGVLDQFALGQGRGDDAGDFFAVQQHVVDPLDFDRLAKRIELAKRIRYGQRWHDAQPHAQFARRAVGGKQNSEVQVALERLPRATPIAVKSVPREGKAGKRRRGRLT